MTETKTKQQRMSIGKQLASARDELDKMRLANLELSQELEHYKRSAVLTSELLTGVADTVARIKTRLEAQLHD